MRYASSYGVHIAYLGKPLVCRNISTAPWRFYAATLQRKVEPITTTLLGFSGLLKAFDSDQGRGVFADEGDPWLDPLPRQ